MLMSSAATLRARIESSLGERLSSTLLLRERTGAADGAHRHCRTRRSHRRLAARRAQRNYWPGFLRTHRHDDSALAAATQRQEVCALVDAGDSFDPASARQRALMLDRLLWIRCSEREQQLQLRDFARNARPQRKAPSPPRAGVESHRSAAAKRRLRHGGARSWATFLPKVRAACR